ncbi:hypothetical protein EW146_g2007 [Bondarzewia mesenterica]|uniref:Methyltransferase type 11 domain-containing protein n=1 Tax=Bondarzewia mesenterica TaxID=1095465 RepID=A0A4S4M233_9AGAM|nr:hypothetical protein EW146_g2007 [Bondarzewia mesenterica]
MATFGKATFNTVRYAAARPTYPWQLFEFVFQYHGKMRSAKWDTAVDLGCGTGQATAELYPFKHVIGVDPGAKMIEQAKIHIAKNGANEQFEFVQSAAEDVSFLEDGSVDLLVAAQAAHWFDWDKMWPEAARLLRTGGSAAFWGYSEFRLSHFPELTPLVSEYAQGSDPATSLGPHWQQPGRSILDNHFLAVPKATDVLPDKFTDWEHIFYTGSHYPDLPNPQPVILRKRMTWDDLLAYFRTFSSLHTFHERYPDDLNNPDGDIALRFRNTLKERTKAENGDYLEFIDLEWPTALMTVRRR